MRQVLVDCGLGEKRPQNVQTRFENNGQQGDCHRPLVAAKVGQQPPHEAGIIGFA
jgi:hypothetical protein